MQQTPIFPLGLDFYFYWAAARAVIDGMNPFDHEVFMGYLRSTGVQFSEDVWYPYLPTSILLLLPLGALPFEAARVVWYVVLTVAVFALLRTGWLLTGLSTEQARAIRKHWPIIAAALLSFPPLLRAVLLGQLTIVLCAALFGALYALRRRKEVLAGMLLTLVVIKPQSTLLVLAALGMQALVRGKWQFFLGFFLPFAAQAGAIALIRPAIWSEYAEFIRVTGPVLASLPHGLSGYLASIGAPKLPFFLAAAEVLAGAAWGFFGVPKLGRVLCIALPVSLLLAPYGWAHESLFLVPALMICVSAAAVQLGGRGAALFLLATIPALFLVPESRIEPYAPLFPIAVIAMCLLLRDSISRLGSSALSLPVFAEKS